MIYNIDSMIKTVRSAKDDLKVRGLNVSFFVYINGDNMELEINIDVCATRIKLDGKAVSKKKMKDMFIKKGK